MAARRWVQIAAGIVLMTFSSWFALSIVYASHGESLWLQPIVQALIVGLIATFIYRAAPGMPTPQRHGVTTADDIRP